MDRRKSPGRAASDGKAAKARASDFTVHEEITKTGRPRTDLVHFVASEVFTSSWQR